MDQREGSKKRARGEEEKGNDSTPVKMTALAAAAAADALAEAAFQEAAPAVVEGGDGDGDAWKPPPGLFDFPWLSCRGGLDAPVVSPLVELRDVFFRSQVDGHTAAVGVPGDRFIAPPSNMMLFVVLAEWVVTAGDDEVDPPVALRARGGQSRRMTPTWWRGQHGTRTPSAIRPPEGSVRVSGDALT